MKYQYKFSFLREWFAANKRISKRDLLLTLGAKSNNGLDSWMAGEGPMPILSILRLCNAYQIPLSAFFVDLDADGTAAGAPKAPTDADVLEPTGGYPDGTAERRRGERCLLDPTDVQPRFSSVPGVNVEDGVVVFSPTHNAPQQAETTNVGTQDVYGQNVNVQNIQHAAPKHSESTEATASALIDMEQKNAERFDRMLSIIADQQKQIADLNNELIAMRQRRRGYGTDSFGNVAEP